MPFTRTSALRYTTRSLALATFLCGGIVATGLSGTPAAAQGISAIEHAKPGDWPSYHRTYDAQRYSPLDQINKDNVKHLHVAWTHQPGDITQGLQATPIAVDGIIYYAGSFNRVFALDGATGDEIWHYYPVIKDGVEKLPTAPYTRGVAVANGMVFIGTIDGRAIALDQKTGKEVWKTQLVDTMKCGCLFTSPPLAVKGKVIYGSTQGGIAARGGGIFGVDQKTGKQAWYFDPVLEGKEHWGTNSFGESSAKYAGVGAWHVGSYDPELDLLYLGHLQSVPMVRLGGTGGRSQGLFAQGRLRSPARRQSLLLVSPGVAPGQRRACLVPSGASARRVGF